MPALKGEGIHLKASNHVTYVKRAAVVRCRRLWDHPIRPARAGLFPGGTESPTTANHRLPNPHNYPNRAVLLDMAARAVDPIEIGNHGVARCRLSHGRSGLDVPWSVPFCVFHQLPAGRGG